VVAGHIGTTVGITAAAITGISTMDTMVVRTTAAIDAGSNPFR